MNVCSLCGNLCPIKCEHCLGALAQQPYLSQQQEEKQEQRMFIGSGEDAHLFLNDSNGVMS